MIDSHVHIMTPRRLKALARWIKRAFSEHPVSETVCADDVTSDLAAHKVDRFFNLVYPLREDETGPLNDFNLEFCRHTPGAVPFASLHQDTADKPKVAAAALAAGHVGLKFHPFVQGFDPWDPRMTPLYEYMESVRRPVLLHTGFELFYGKPMPAIKLIELAERYPRLPFVFVHMAFPDLAQVFAAMDRLPDLYLDATNVLAFFRPGYLKLTRTMAKGQDLLGLLLEGLEQKKGRIMYGSDHPVGMGGYDEIMNDLHSLPLSASARTALSDSAAEDFLRRFGPEWMTLERKT